MNIFFRVTPILILSFSSSLPSAWNGFGHMVVAAVAYDHLTDQSKAHVFALLKLNPNYSDRVADTSDKYKDRVAFMRAAIH